MKEYLEIHFWTNCKSRNEIREKLNKTYIFKDDLYELQLLSLFIRDRKLEYGLKDISRWMLLELEIKYPKFCKELIPILKDFGYWKDYNLMLREINGNILYQDIESEIYLFLLDTFKKDIDNFENKQYNQISNLVKYIGKERKNLDKTINFVARFTKLLYPELDDNQRKKKYRIICRKINNIVNIKKKKNNILKMVSAKRDRKNYNLDYIKKNLQLFNRYNISSKYNPRFNKSIIRSENDIYNTRRSGNYIYDDLLIDKKIVGNYNIDKVIPFDNKDKWHTLNNINSIKNIPEPKDENIYVYCFKNNKTTLFDLVKKYENFNNIRKIQDLKIYQKSKNSLNMKSFYSYSLENNDSLYSDFSSEDDLSPLTLESDNYYYSKSLSYSSDDLDEDINSYLHNNDDNFRNNNEKNNLDWWQEIDLEKGNTYQHHSLSKPYHFDFTYPVKIENIKTKESLGYQPLREIIKKPITSKIKTYLESPILPNVKLQEIQKIDKPLKSPIFDKLEISIENKEENPNKIVVEKPNKVLEEKPNKVLVEKPNKVLEEKPNKVLVEKPNKVIVEKPNKVLEEKPNKVLVEKPNKVLEEKPNKVLVEKPNKVLEEKPNKVLEEKPNNWSFGFSFFGFNTEASTKINEEKSSIIEEEYEIIDFNTYNYK